MGARMMNLGLNVKVNMDRVGLLDILRKNREEHVTMHREATEGFVVQATAKLKKSLDAFAAGTATDLYIHLDKPESYVDAYDTVISMLESTADATIAVSAAEYRQLVQDQWDWTKQWLSSNSSYSTTIAAKLADAE